MTVRTHADKPAAFKNRITRSTWRALQREAKDRSVAVDTVLDERGPLPTKRIEIEVPEAFVELLRYELGSFGVSRPELARSVASALLTVDIESFCEQMSNVVHRSRNAAYRVAVATFVRDHGRRTIALRYNRRGRVEHELFRNPLSAIKAA